MLIMMVVVLVTFQGTEIVGLAAAESQNPDKSVPKACRSVTYRIVGLYLVPILLVLLVFPTEFATDATPVFSDIAKAYGFEFFGIIFLAVSSGSGIQLCEHRILRYGKMYVRAFR